MTYEKPAIVEVADAIDAVQGSLQKHSPPIDLSGQTVNAYQSDEQ
ncbi:MAG TPA: hypothetical protein VJN92_19610 [Candidatus Acidoferrum sp.]|nr:hypothetical protein [Candidatus Acidoferrum sp.]